jgi:predicted transcriptional regulator of viral defense system
MAVSDRNLLTKLSRSAKGGLISVAVASELLKLPSRTASQKLAAMARRGWLRRARRGLYFILPLEADPSRPAIIEDAWILAREVFSPCYIGGWSAAEYWGLTEQIFKETLVITAAPIRSRSITILGHSFLLFQMKPKHMSAATMVWRGSERVAVSSAELTIVDCLQYPHLCGGIRHLADIMNDYGSSEKRDMTKLLKQAKQRNSGAVWKRLGFLAETLWPSERSVIEEALRNVSAGNIKLDPDVRNKGRLLRRWRLCVNIDMAKIA